MAIVRQEIEEIGRFIALLEEEQGDLKSGTVDRLAEFAARKLVLVENLNALSAQRRQHMGIGPEVPERTATDSWQAQHPDDEAAAEWKKLLDLAREAKSLNELNAQIVDMRLRQTNEILAILSQPSADPALYGASGQTVSSTGSRIVDSA